MELPWERALTTISYSREEKRAISPQSVCLPLFAFFEIFSHILVLSSSLSLAFTLSLILIWIICLFTFTRHISFALLKSWAVSRWNPVIVEICPIFAIDCFYCISYVYEQIESFIFIILCAKKKWNKNAHNTNYSRSECSATSVKMVRGVRMSATLF